MALSLSDNQVRFLRLRAQQLIPQPTDNVTSVAHVVKELCGIQAQNAQYAALAVRVRCAGLVAADVERERVRERSVIRTWGQRGTLHLLATEDLGWLLSLFGSIFIAANRSRRMELGLDEETCAKGIDVMRDILADQGPLTRDELVARLGEKGVCLEGQARPHLISYAALEGLICLGPDRGAKPTYVLLDDWIDRKNLLSLPQDTAYTELAQRYIAAYGPTRPDDMAAWSGLPIKEIRAAWQRIAGSLVEVEIAHRPAWMLATHRDRLDEFSAHPLVIRLLPGFDTYLLGYSDRELVVSAQFAKYINAGGGMIHPTLLVNGRAIGLWRSVKRKKQLEVIVEPFELFAPEVQPGLKAEVMDIGRFLGTQVILENIVF